MPIQLCAVSVYFIIVVVLMVWDMDHDFFTPKDFYDKGLNWFGSILVFILFMMFNPLGLIVRTIYWIYRFFKWLFTVGRQED